MDPSAAKPFLHDAFISYSRKDKAFAAKLEKALEDYSPPRDLNVPQRHLDIFRDEEDFTGTEYHRSLEKHLHDSAKLIVLCSPSARQSTYVNDEIRLFAKEKGPEHIIPLLVAGIPNNEAKPGQEAEMAFPVALYEVMGTGIPLAADYRGFDVRTDRITRGRFEDAWVKTLADLYTKSRAEIEQRERKRRMRRRWTAATVSGLVLLVMGGTGTWLWRQDLTLVHALLRVVSKFMSIHRVPEVRMIPAGTFRQGAFHSLGNWYAEPPHKVTTKPFALGKHEVTFEEYDRFAIATGRPLPFDEHWGRSRRPVINVSWEDAAAYAEWLSKATGKSYRLPTESEWEYAARSGGRDEMWAGVWDEGQLTDFAVYHANSGRRTVPVGEKKPNGLGLHDMSGNVSEWVEDCWHETYNGAPSDGSAWLEAGGGQCGERVIRGGSWEDGGNYLRVSDRSRQYAEFGTFAIGFRLAQDID